MGSLPSLFRSFDTMPGHVLLGISKLSVQFMLELLFPPVSCIHGAPSIGTDVRFYPGHFRHCISVPVGRSHLWLS